jgi:membrane protease subunit (stomatin/prohibitin family)
VSALRAQVAEVLPFTRIDRDPVQTGLAGAGAAYMGMNLGMGAAGGFMQSASSTNQAQMQYQQNQYQAQGQQFQQEQAPGAPRMKQPGEWFCPECGTLNGGNFCMNCGTKKPE